MANTPSEQQAPAAATAPAAVGAAVPGGNPVKPLEMQLEIERLKGQVRERDFLLENERLKSQLREMEQQRQQQ